MRWGAEERSDKVEAFIVGNPWVSMFRATVVMCFAVSLYGGMGVVRIKKDAKRVTGCQGSWILAAILSHFQALRRSCGRGEIVKLRGTS